MKKSLLLHWCVLALFTFLVGCKKEEGPEIVTVKVRVTHNNAPVTNVDVGAGHSLDDLDNNAYKQKQTTNASGEATIKIARESDLYFETEAFINGKAYYGRTYVSTSSAGKDIPLQEIKLAEAQMLPKQVVQTKGNTPNGNYFNLTYYYDDQNRLVKSVKKSLVYQNTEEFCAFSYYPDGKLQRIDYGHGSSPYGSSIYVEFKHHPDLIMADYNYPGGLSSRIVDTLYFGFNGLPFYFESNDIDHSNFNTVSNFNYSAGTQNLSWINEFYPNSSVNNSTYYYSYDYFSENPFYKDRNTILQVKYGYRPLFLDEWAGISSRNINRKDGSTTVNNVYTYTSNNLPDSVSTNTKYNPTEWVRQKVYYCWR